MTIASALKYVAVGGISFGLATVPHRAMQRTFASWFWERPGYSFSALFSICLLVLSTFEFFRAAIAIRAEPTRPGAGRWIWAIFGGVVFLDSSVSMVIHAIPGASPLRIQTPSLFWLHVALMSLPGLCYNLKFLPLFLWLGCRVARVSRPPRMDGQEWSARVLAILLPPIMIASALWGR